MPACAAMIVQFPAANRDAVLPETAQTPLVDDVYATLKPELAIAFKVNGVPTVCAAIELKVIVCDPPFTVKLCETGIAGA